MTNELKPLPLGYAGGIVSALGMFVLGILGNLGFYVNAAQMMQEWHMFFSLNLVGIITGMVEAAVIGFVFMYAIALVYNNCLVNTQSNE